MPEGWSGWSLRRLEHEARAAGVLNHPGITAVFDIGTHEGSPFLVHELLEGETLRTALAGGRVPARKAIDYAIQIARGLAAAHEKGIVHRDLKAGEHLRDPRRAGEDPGLRPRQAHGGGRRNGGHESAHRDQGHPARCVGGTFAYMSPEQVRGQPADARSDIFSFAHDLAFDLEALSMASTPGTAVSPTSARRRLPRGALPALVAGPDAGAAGRVVPREAVASPAGQLQAADVPARSSEVRPVRPRLADDRVRRQVGRRPPKGDAVAFLDHPIFSDDRGAVALADRTGNRRTLAGDWANV